MSSLEVILVTLSSECLYLLLSVMLDPTLPTLLSTLSLTLVYSLFTHTSLPIPCTKNRSQGPSNAARANSWEPRQSQKTSLRTLWSTLSLTPRYSLFTHTSLPTQCMRNRSHLHSHATRANSWETPAVSIYLSS